MEKINYTSYTKYLTIKVPIYVLLIVFIASYGLFTYLNSKPPLDTVHIQIEGAKRCIDRYPTDNFVYTYNTLNVKEYYSIYKICYGKLPEKEEILFTEFFKKYPVRE